MELPKALEGEWTQQGRRLLIQILQKPPKYETISFAWVCRILGTSEPHLKIALTNKGTIGHNLVKKYRLRIERNGWPILVLLYDNQSEHGVFAKNETMHEMDIVCKGVGKRAFVWSTSSGR